MMKISRVWIEDGCVSCAACQSAAPDVFVVNDVADVIPGVDFDDFYADIVGAAEGCPVAVIKYE